jgi:hypothetical protein
LKRIAQRLTYANVMATIALFFAIGGTTIAGAQALLTGADIKNGSLTAADLANSSVTKKKISTGAVRSRSVRNGSLRSVDIRNGSLRAADLSTAAREVLKGYKTLSFTSPDIADLSDPVTVLDEQLLGNGVYLISGRVTFTNNSGAQQGVDCVVLLEGNQVTGFGTTLDDGASATGQLPFAYTVKDASQGMQLLCEAPGAASGVTVSGIQLSLFKLT